MKNKKTILIIIGAALALIIIGSVLFYNNGIGAVSSKSEEVIVEVKQGDTASQVLNTLEESGLIKNKFCGKLFLKLNNYELKKNTYVLNKNMSLSEMYKIMDKGDFKYLVKTELKILDGNTIPEVAKSLAKVLNITDKEVIKKWEDTDYLKQLAKDYWFIDEKTILNKDLMFPLEGYLFPDTYYITEQEPTIESLTKVSLDAMDKMLTKYKDDIEKLNWTTHQFLTFASVVERESGTDETDRPMIAGVFMNRLKQGMLLQSDITVNYAWQRTGVDVLFKHLEIDSKYNTYKYTGLPVGPISTISEKTIQSCIDYTKHDYLYFFAMKDSKDPKKTVVVYTKTNQEHEKKVKEAKAAGLWLD